MIVSMTQALEKLKNICARREYCQQDARNKLQDLGIYGDDADELIIQLITQDFINEERYACSYANDKIKLSHWGWRKVEENLRKKNISAYCIKKARKYVPLLADEEAFDAVAEKKWEALAKQSYMQQRSKFTRYMLQRGFSFEQINSYIQDISKV